MAIKKVAKEYKKLYLESFKIIIPEFKIILPIISGVLIVLIQPPISISPMAFVALAPLLVSLKKDRLYQNFLAGLLAGFVGYLGTVYWVVVAMNRYGGLDFISSILIMLLLVLYMSFYIGIFCYAITFFDHRFSIPIYLSSPFIWVILEYIRGFLMTGFPWAFLAYSQHNFLPFIQVVSITGVYFISFMIVAVNCIFYRLWTKKSIPVLFTLIVAILLISSIVYGFIRLKNDSLSGEIATVAVIQGNISQDIKWDEQYKAKMITKYYQMTLDHGKGSNLVIWPETAIPLVINSAKQVDGILRSLAVSIDADLLFGTVHMEDNDRLYNSAYLFHKNGTTSGLYNKVHLVPFGEYTPLVEYLPFLSKITAVGGGFSPGKSHMPVTSSLGAIGVLICYEGIFPEISVNTVRKGAQVLVNLTNDAWYDRTSAPYQHLSFYVFRAIETERYVIRAANTGISAIIDTRGRIKEKTGIFDDAVLKGEFLLSHGRTFYVKYGDWFIYSITGGFVILVGIFFILKKFYNKNLQKP
ncbi:MAG TPA: apolipoprotein N-acyltransferase [Syntrophorhabdaceae bacterium]|nr:apolipoprotein N-acyltransferase [Syntrophorhabdaceae bacterium]